VLISRFVDNTPLRNNPTLQSCITNAFCYLLSSMDDRSTYVATRATLLLPTIHDSALKVMFVNFNILFFLIKWLLIIYIEFNSLYGNAF